MRHTVWGVVCALALVGSAAAEEAKDNRSANAVLPHCMAGLAPDSQDLIGARCLGIIGTLSFVSRVLPDNLKFCQPGATPPEELVRVIAAFMEANPDASVQDFRLVALAAMRDKWPCED